MIDDISKAIDEIIERHKETLDMLAEDDGPVLEPCPCCNGKNIDAVANPIFAGLSTMEAIMTDIPFWKCECRDCGKKFGVDMLGRVKE